MEKNVYPKNLDIKSEHFNIAFATNDIKESLCQLDQKTITEKMSLCITHFKLKVIELEEEIVIHKDKLRNICDGEQLTFLQNKLKQFKDKFYKELEKKKHKKFNKLFPSLSEIWNTQNQWIPNLNLTNQDRLNIRNNEEIDDFIILQAINLLQKQYPIITTQTPSLAFSTGYSYCPSETVQITHTGSHHWVLLSFMYSKLAIYDSLNLQTIDFLLNQIRQLFSCNNSMPNFEQIKCDEQVGSRNCGLLAIAYAADILNANNIYDLIYDQTKMREHLIACF